MAFVLWAQLNLPAPAYYGIGQQGYVQAPVANFVVLPSPRITVRGGGRRVEAVGGGRRVSAVGGGRRVLVTGGGR
jgi:hypothetical protein